MPKYTTTRLHETAPRIVGRAPSDYAQELQEFLEKLLNKTVGGIPAGFNDSDPVDINAGDAASPGLESAGWAAADHEHAVSTAAAAELTPISTNTEGSSSSLARSDHSHAMQKVMADIVAKCYLRL